MFKKVFCKYINVFKKRKIFSTVYILIYLLSIVIGVFLYNKNNNYQINLIIKNYRNITLGLYSNPLKLFFIRTINNFFSFILIYLASYKVCLCFFNFILISYRGIVLGGVALHFIKVLGVEGVVLYFFVIFVQNVIVTLSLIYSVLYIYSAKKIKKCKYTNNYVMQGIFLGFLLSFVAILYELLLLLFFLRPLNIYF